MSTGQCRGSSQAQLDHRPGRFSLEVLLLKYGVRTVEQYSLTRIRRRNQLNHLFLRGGSEAYGTGQAYGHTV